MTKGTKRRQRQKEYVHAGALALEKLCVAAGVDVATLTSQAAIKTLAYRWLRKGALTTKEARVLGCAV